VPTIACINRAKTDLDVGFDKLIHALQIYLDDCFVPIWRTPAKLVKATKPRPGAWTMVFLDDADRPETFGRHDHTKNGLPLSRIFVKSTLEAGQSISLVASHELAEMMVDPALNLWCFGPKDAFYVYEVCDPVEEEDFPIDGIAMSDFVYPSYFEGFRKPRSTQFDYLRKVDRPFAVLPGGYLQARKGKTVKHIFGSEEKRRRVRKEDRRLHRSECRKEHFSRG